MIHDISLAPKNNVVQNLAMTRGRELYEDTDGTWKLPSNAAVLDGSKGRVRPILQGSYYAFTVDNQYIRGYLPTIENTDSWRYRTFFRSSDSGNTISFLIVNYDNGDATRKGLALYFFGTAHPTYPGKLAVQLIGDLSIDDRITIVSDISIVTGNWTFVDVEYDGSKLASGISIKVNGVTQTFTTLFDALTLSIVDRNDYSICTPVSGGAGTASFDLSKCIFTVNGTEILRLGSEETSGLVAFDSSGQDNYGTIEILGAAESSFHLTSNEVVSYANDYGYNKGAYFDGTTYASNTATLSLTNYEFEINIIFDDPTATRYEYVVGTPSFNILKNNNGTTIRIPEFPGTNVAHNGKPVNRFVVRNFSTTSAIITLNGVEVYNGAGFGAGTFTNFIIGDYTTGGFPFYGSISYLRIAELDGGGAEISEPYLLDFDNADETTIPNIGADAPASSDMVWNNNSRYTIIPVDLSIPTQDVLGNVLPAEYTGEVSYDALVKSSSVASFDYNLWGETPYDAAFSLQNFEIVVELAITNVTRQSHIFAVNCVNAGSPSWRGILVRWRDISPSWEITVEDGAGGLTVHNASNFTPVSGVRFKIRVRRYNNNIYLTTDDADEVSYSSSQTIQYETTNEGIIIGASYGSGKVINANKLTGEIYNVEYYSLNATTGARETQLFKSNFSERNGRIWYNTAVDAPAATNAAVILNGSTDGDQWSTSDVQRPTNLLDGFNHYDYYKGATRLELGDHSEFEIQNLEIEIEFIPLEEKDNWFCAIQVADGTTYAGGLILAARTTSGNTKIRYASRQAESVSLVDLLESTLAPIANKRNYLSLRKFGAGATVDINLNGSSETLSTTAGNLEFSTVQTQNTWIGQEDNQSSSIGLFGGIRVFRLYGLDASGNRVSTLIDMDYDNPIGDVVRNIASSAPLGSDGYYADGIRSLLYVPKNPSIPDEDAAGASLVYDAQGIKLLPTENLYDRNYADARTPLNAGIAQGEDISYEDITADISRFYRDRGTWVQDLLTYSDFVEPMSSGGYNMTNNQYVTYPSNDTLTPANGDTIEVSCRINFNSTALQRIWHVGGGTVYANVEFIIYSTSDLRIGSPGVTLSYDNPNIVTGQWYDFRVVAVNNQAFDTIELWQDGVKYLTTSTRANLINISTIEAIMGNLLAVVASGGLNGIVSDFAIKVNDVVQAEYHYEENGGLVSYDISGNGNHGLLTTNGASLDSIHVADTTPEYIHNLKYGRTRGGVFDGAATKYLKITSAALLVNDFEYYINFYTDKSGGSYDSLAGVASDISNLDNHVQRLSQSIRVFINGANRSSTSGVVNTNSLNVVHVKKYGVNLEITLNGNLTSYSDVSATITYSLTESHIGTLLSYAFNLENGAITKFIYNELNSSGAVVNNLVEMDWENGTNLEVPNIAANSVGNFLWNNEDGNYVSIPADPATPGLTVDGQVISNQAEVTKYNRINNYLTK
jgi:hypothetical protein